MWEPSYTVGGNANWFSHCGNQYKIFLKNFSKIKLPCDPAIPLMGIYTKKTKTLIGKYICMPVFPAALFTIAKSWK